MKSDSSLGKNVSVTCDKKKYDFLCALFDMEKLCFALVLKMDFSIVGKEKKNDVDECVRKCGHWVHIDVIKTYEQR